MRNVLLLLTLATTACGARAAQPAAPRGTAPDDAAATGDRFVAQVSAGELEARLADGRWQRWSVQGLAVSETSDMLSGGITATATGIVASQCQPGGAGVEFFIDEQQRVLAHATYYTYAPKDHAGQPMATPAIRCFTYEYPLAAGQIYYGELEVTP